MTTKESLRRAFDSAKEHKFYGQERHDVWLDFESWYQANAKDVDGWTSVEVRLPQPQESGYARTVLALDNSGQMHVAYWDESEWCVYHMCCTYNGPIANVTHWMPLPAPPEDK